MDVAPIEVWPAGFPSIRCLSENHRKKFSHKGLQSVIRARPGLMLRRGSRKENNRWRQHEDNFRVRFCEKRPGVVKWFEGNGFQGP